MNSATGRARVFEFVYILGHDAHSSLGYRPPARETIWLKPAPLRRLQPAFVSTELLRYNVVLTVGSGQMPGT